MRKMRTIVCHGDSLTEGADLDINYTWPALVENELKVKVLNSGIGGDTTGGLVSRFYPDVVQRQPFIVVIMGGTNDLWWDLSINTIQANVFTMACQAQYHNISPVIGLPLPLFMEGIRKQDMMEPVSGYEKCLEKLSRLVNVLSISAEKNEIPCLDFYHSFLDDKGKVIGNYFLEDGLHPNKEGHRRMAEKTTQLLRSVFNLI